ncbi:MAG: erythrose-4-phosphate dehydrogenase, partial [Kangiella sp.]|nr:erythrose-4-phosphate dehydrogenase [Kangiella sp.]
SCVDLTFEAGRDTTAEEINEIVKKAADGHVLCYNDEPLVSVDFNHSPASSTFDAGLTRVQDGNFVKVVTWYDNEWGFSNRMLDVAIKMMSV